ncbi:hypothetical protein DUI87_04575 [Hirundo rustica rustica]|uniref:RING-type E3 ubiquitin transferase n=1 Tax=Hirundo rustica rustica TaxID=333673 RepID=A0A3M0KZF4_HIRRU|nr:hypothetical protein DUI87_04575 [Hirundo rustica rustica]
MGKLRSYPDGHQDEHSSQEALNSRGQIIINHFDVLQWVQTGNPDGKDRAGADLHYWFISSSTVLLRGELLSPCRCDGSVKCTHQPCLIKWISERGCWSCELCYYKYHVIAISTKNPLQWQAISLTVIEKVQIAAAILGSLFLIASISWLIWSTFSPSAKWQRQDLLFQICYGMYGFMDIVCIGG